MAFKRPSKPGKEEEGMWEVMMHRIEGDPHHMCSFDCTYQIVLGYGFGKHPMKQFGIKAKRS